MPRDYMLHKGARDFFHTGLNIARSELKGLLDGQNPSVKMYVAPWGSDTKDGGTWDRAFETIAKAIAVNSAAINWGASPWALNREIHIAPGKYAENLESFPHGSSLLGHGDAFDLNGERGVTIKPASGSPVDCTSIINSRIENICFDAPADAGTEVLFQTDNFNRNVLVNCIFNGVPGASPTTTRGFEVVKDMTGNILSGCRFNACRNGIYIVTDNANSKQASGNTLEYLNILGGDQTGIHFDANCVPSLTIIDHCNIAGAGTTLALGLDDDSDIVTVFNTNFEATANDPASGAGKYSNCYLNGGLIT